MRVRFAVLILSTSLLMTALPSAEAITGCEEAQRRVASTTEASPHVFTREIAEALRDVTMLCELDPDSDLSGHAPGHYHVKGPKRGGSSPPPPSCSGTLTGVAEMQIIIAAPGTWPIPYSTPAAVVFDRTSSMEQMVARDPTATGFDASFVTGMVYLAGVPIFASYWDVGSECNSLGRPCHAAGYAVHVSVIQLFMATEIGGC